MKNLVFALIFCLTTVPVTSHEFRIMIVDENGTLLPCVHAMCQRTEQYLLSNEEGVLIISDEDFLDEDILIFESIFYEKCSFDVKTLTTLLKVTLQSKSFSMGAVIVRPSESADKMIKEMSASFAKRYVRNYAAKVLHLRSVECNGRYREFNGLQGLFASLNFTQSPPSIYFLDKNRINMIPLTVMRSDPFIAGGDEVLEINSVSLTGNTDIKRGSKDALTVEFQNLTNLTISDAKRALELYTPLNPKQHNNFTYSLDSVYFSGEDKIYVIRFKTRSSSYPQKTKVYGQGYIYYNQNRKIPEKIVIENHQDQYAIFPRRNMLTLLPSATQHLLEVNYGIEEGFIYTKSISLKVNWVDPRVNENFYIIKVQSRRNPIKHKLKEYEYYEFSDPVTLNHDQIEMIKTNMSSFETTNSIHYGGYVAPFDRKKWENTTLPGIDLSRLILELSTPERSFWQQAHTNGMDCGYFTLRSEDPDGATAILQKYHLKASEILYPILYHKNYE